MFISDAYAQSAAGGDPGLLGFLPIVLIVVVFYFLLIRPQTKRQKEHRAMVAAIRRGDVIVTGGGIVGTVKKVESGEEVMVEIAEGVRIKVVTSTIMDVRSKTEPASNDNKDA